MIQPQMLIGTNFGICANVDGKLAIRDNQEINYPMVGWASCPPSSSKTGKMPVPPSGIWDIFLIGSPLKLPTGFTFPQLCPQTLQGKLVAATPPIWKEKFPRLSWSFYRKLKAVSTRLNPSIPQENGITTSASYKFLLTPFLNNHLAKFMLLELNKLIIPPGHQLLIKDVSWQMYKRILSELGENRQRIRN
jgi:hypothetical protein